MTEFDREFLRELRGDHYRELRQTMDDEHRRGLNPNPYYHWTREEIEHHEASLNADIDEKRDESTEEE